MSCSRNAEDDDTANMPVRPKGSKPSICVRCRERPVEISRSHAHHCRVCFAFIAIRRFRELMPNCRPLDERSPTKSRCTDFSILLVMRDDLASRVTLDYLHTLYFEEKESGATQRPSLFTDLRMVHVRKDDSISTSLDDLHAFAARYSRTIDVVDMQDVFHKSGLAVEIRGNGMPLSSARDHADILLAARGLSATARQSLSAGVQDAYMCQYAHEHGHRILIFPQTSTELAAVTLSAIANGQGYSLGEAVGVADVVVPGTNVRVYRPLSALNNDEVLFQAQTIKGWTISSPAIPQDDLGISGLVQKFVSDLERSFPSTVSVISRTSGKVGMRSAGSVTLPQCPLCSLPADTQARQWRKAASLSTLSDADASGENENENKSTTHDVGTTQDLADMLCYGCLANFLELQNTPLAVNGMLKTRLSLPNYSESIINERTATRNDLRPLIEEFLL